MQKKGTELLWRIRVAGAQGKESKKQTEGQKQRVKTFASMSEY